MQNKYVDAVAWYVGVSKTEAKKIVRKAMQEKPDSKSFDEHLLEYMLETYSNQAQKAFYED